MIDWPVLPEWLHKMLWFVFPVDCTTSVFKDYQNFSVDFSVDFSADFCADLGMRLFISTSLLFKITVTIIFVFLDSVDPYLL